MKITQSKSIADIIAVSERSAEASGGIRILELGSLGDIIPAEPAEAVRRHLLASSIKIRQLTNLRQFDAWTRVDGFVEHCMQVRRISARVLPIGLEMLLFDDVVALYRVQPEVSVLVIEDADFATQQRALFDATWAQAEPLSLRADGSTS